MSQLENKQPKGLDRYFGTCHVCGGAKPDTDNADGAYSSNQIDDNEYVPLYWSAYYNDFVCHRHLVDRADDRIDERRRQNDREGERKRQKMGFVKTYTKQS